MVIYSTKNLNKVQDLISSYGAKNTFLLFDQNTIRDCDLIIRKEFPDLNNSVRIIIPADDDNKTIEKSTVIWDNLVQYEATKKSLLINVGGGMITDIGGFSAACFKRGIDFINIPTTLLAMVDASFGGKTGVNFRHTKNQIGVFADAKCVYVNPVFLNTLPRPQLRSGLAEMIKHELLFNPDAIDYILEKRTTDYWIKESTILQNMQYKVEVVEKDYFDKCQRQYINFGHTIGHAIESLSHQRKTPILHGEAILLGMIEELKIAEKLFNCPDEIRILLQDVKKKYFPILDFSYSLSYLMPYLKQDKKNDNEIRFSLLKNVAEPVAQVGVGEETLKNILA